MENDTELEGALTGALAALAANWVRADNNSQRLVLNARETAREAEQAIRALGNSGFIQRLSRPIVSDALGGLLLAEQRPDQPSVTPSLRQIRRIGLAHGMKQHIDGLRWPPKEGEYDENGLCKKPGDLVTLFLGKTYGESQAWELGLLQNDAPTREQREQIYYAANAMTEVLYGTKLTFEQFVEAWKRMFTGSSTPNPGTPTPVVDPHDDPAHPPTIAGINLFLSSVKPLGSEALGNAYPYVSQNTDRVNKWRVSVNLQVVPAGQNLFEVVFNKPFARGGMPYAPVVTAQGLNISAASVTAMGFGVQSSTAIAANTSIDIGFCTSGG